MTYSKGQKVAVKDYSGEWLTRRVWRDAGAIVFITSDEVFRLLSAGETELWPIGSRKQMSQPLGEIRQKDDFRLKRLRAK
jgi:hypothetical protein